MNPANNHVTPIKAVIFDLDGTLLDTIQDIADTMNFVLANNKLPVHSISTYEIFVGQGLEKLVWKVLPKQNRNQEMVENLINSFRNIYSDRWIHTRPYSKIHKTLTELDNLNIPYSVLSNKPHRFTVKMVEKYFPTHNFFHVKGANSDFPKKPDPQAALHMINMIDVNAENTLFIGDSHEDIQTARNAKMRSIGVTWGLNPVSQLIESQADWIVNGPLEILNIITALNDN